MKPHSYVIASSAAVAILAGCGGGSGSSSSASAPPATNLSSAPAQTAMAAYVQASHKYTLKASNGGNSYTLQLANVPNPGVTKFNESAPAYSSVDTITLDENGVHLANSSSTDYFLLNPYVPLGKVASSGTPYGVVTSSVPLPQTFDVGSSGSVDSMTYYHDSTMSTRDADETVNYSVEANDSTTLLMCMESTITNVTAQGVTDDLVDDGETDCYRVDDAGNATLVSVALTVNGATLTFH